MLIFNSFTTLILKASEKVINTLLPCRCLKCGDIISSEGKAELCPHCWANIRFIASPYCKCCGYPFEISDEFTLSTALLCGPCLKKPPPYQEARTVFAYDDASKPLIMKFKHGDATYAAPTFARWMQRAGQEMIERAEVLIPVPLHWRRLMARQYNQAALLTVELSKITKTPVCMDALSRHRHTPSQGQKSKEERQKNVKGAFKVPQKRLVTIENRSILLIDDVLTSGATLDACTTTLLKAGAAQVSFLGLARVIRPEYIHT